MKEELVYPFCPYCGKIKPRQSGRKGCHPPIRKHGASLFCGCSICGSPYIVSYEPICSNPECIGWELNNNFISHAGNAVFHYTKSGSYYVYDLPNLEVKVKSFFKKLYYDVVKLHKFPRQKYISLD